LRRLLVIGLALVGAARTAHAVPWYTEPPPKPWPSKVYGAMTQDECEAELVTRGVPFTREPPTRGVRAPVRLTGPLRGVLYRSDGSEEARRTSVYEIVDCRLVLALDDFAAILERHGVVEVRHWSMYRPPPKSFPEGKEGKRHKGGLAIDLGWMKLADGSRLEVYDDYHGRRGSRSCGPKARPPRPKTERATLLRAILCEAAASHLFTVVLTPNYNRKHRNHFHLEVAVGVDWYLVR
jgi:hypothetical protein